MDYFNDIIKQRFNSLDDILNEVSKSLSQEINNLLKQEKDAAFEMAQVREILAEHLSDASAYSLDISDAAIMTALVMHERHKDWDFEKLDAFAEQMDTIIRTAEKAQDMRPDELFDELDIANKLIKSKKNENKTCDCSCKVEDFLRDMGLLDN